MPLWDYSMWDKPTAFGDEVTYAKGLPWLDECCATIEDWGCGLAFGRQFVKNGTYTGIDSSPSSAKFDVKHADLRDYRSHADGIFMRHVLEHNTGWRMILQNALGSFRKRFVLVIFTPFSATTRPMQDGEILDISFRKKDLTDFFTPYDVREEHLTTGTQYGGEHMFYIEKPA